MNDEYEAILAKWTESGFVEPGWSVDWESREGARRYHFQTGSKGYSLVEAEMEHFIAGASAMFNHWMDGLNRGDE